MSIPNEALQKVRPSCSIPRHVSTYRVNSSQLAQEIETQAISAQREINVVKGAVAAKQRDVRMLELTSKELDGLSKDINVYEGVGKMFVQYP